ncbi:MFS transporter [Chitinivorax sp. B]|uniref:MFS transporter n=1 Tax=Chitinivorax sp. B TaxID=2502235 RepID=UPI0010F5ED35|nr:MFS transporter [Chitinivorax sp. B]
MSTSIAAEQRPARGLGIFREHNARMVFFGRLSVLTGDVIQDVALIWIVWELTHSSAATAIASMSSRTPLWLFSLPAGVYADANDPKRTLLWANLLCSLLAFCVAGFAHMGMLNVPLLCVLAFAISTCRTFEMPSFYAAVRGLTNGTDTQQLNGVADTAKRLARLVAPLLANAIKNITSVFNLYAVIGVFYACMAMAGRKMDVRSFRQRQGPRQGIVGDLREALVVIKQRPALQFIIAAEILFNVAYGACYYVFLPRLTMDTTGGGAFGYAAAVTAFGTGGLLAGFLSSHLKMHGQALRYAMVGWLGMGLFFGLMCLTRSLWVIVAFSAVVGAAMAIQTIALWSALHESCPAEHSGRVYSIWRLGADAAITVSTLTAGVVTDAFGPSMPIGVIGIYVLLAIPLARRLIMPRVVPLQEPNRS